MAPTGPSRRRPAVDPVVGTAVLLATVPAEDGGPASLLAWEHTTLLGRLLDQLVDLGVREVHVVTRPDWADAVEAAALGHPADARVHASPDLAGDLAHIERLGRRGRDGIVLLAADVLTQREALAGLLADPRIPSGVLSSGGRTGRPFGFRMRARRGRVVSAASPYHLVRHPTSTFLEVLKVAPAERERLADVAGRLRALTEDGLPAGWHAALEEKAGRWRGALRRRGGEPEAMADDEPDGDAEEELDAEEEPPPGEDGTALDPVAEAELARRVAAAREDACALLLTGLVRSGAQVGESRLRTLFWARPLSAANLERAAQRIVRHDEDAALLATAVKASDGFFTTHFVSPYSKHIARWGARHGWTPNAVTTVSVGIGALAAAAFATGERWGAVSGAVLLQAAFTFDCVDGQLARYTRTFTKLGAWLDSIFDRTKEYAVFAGLAIGAARSGDDVWLLAGAALTLQVARHAIDFSFPAVHHQALGAVRHPPLEQPEDWVAPVPAVPRAAAPTGAGTGAARPAGAGRVARRLLRRIDRSRRTIWVKKMIAFPIGERFAAISISAALFSPRVCFRVLLSWGGLGMAWSLTGRVLRSLGRRGALLDRTAGAGPGAPDAYRDDGPLALALGRLAGPGPLPAAALVGGGVAVLGATVALLGSDASWPVAGAAVSAAIALAGATGGQPLRDRMRWLVPSGLRVIEYGGLLWVAALAGPEAVPAAFAFLSAVTFRHYDRVYRLRHRGTLPPDWLNTAAGGWDGRLAAGTALAAAGVAPRAYYGAAALLGGVSVVESVAGWVGHARDDRPAVYEDAEEDEE